LVEELATMQDSRGVGQPLDLDRTIFMLPTLVISSFITAFN
jgi:hypothetical protein